MKRESPADSFKRAVAGAVRSLAAEPELEVTFSPEPPMLIGKKVRLPLPSRSLSADEVAAVRGAGDAYALRLAYHEDNLDKDIRPAGGDANAIYEVAEQARVEAIGALAMPGVKDNLAAVLAMRCKAHGLGDVQEQTQAPLVDVLSLMVRTPDRRNTAANRQAGRRSLAALHRGESRAPARSTEGPDSQPALLRKIDACDLKRPRTRRICRRG